MIAKANGMQWHGYVIRKGNNTVVGTRVKGMEENMEEVSGR